MPESTTDNPLKKVAEPTERAKRFIKRAALPRALMGGTESMRAMGEVYLPQNPAEHESQYKIRLHRTYLFNAFERAVQMLLGKVFANQVIVNDDTPEKIRDWSENIDLEGRDVTTFGEDLLKESIMTGRASVLVDMQQNPFVFGTLEDEQRAGIRPYLSLIPGDSVIGWRVQEVMGVPRLSQLRVLEVKEVPDGQWGVEEIKRVRVYYAGDPNQPLDGTEKSILRYARFEVYEERKLNDNGETRWVGPVQWGTLRPFEDIPLVTHYTGREGFFDARPPLDDLAWKNVEHWNSSSEQRNVLHAARVPILFGKGFTEQEKRAKKVIGSLVGWFAGSEAAGLDYVEAGGGSIQAGFEDLEMIKEDMSTLALRPMLQRPSGSETATAKALETVEADSRLEAWAISLGDVIGQCYEMMAIWADMSPSGAGSVTVNTDFGLGEMGREAVEQAYKARQLGDISRRTYWRVLDDHEVLPEGFDGDEEEKLLKEEMPTEAIKPREMVNAPNEVNNADSDRTRLGLDPSANSANENDGQS